MKKKMENVIDNWSGEYEFLRNDYYAEEVMLDGECYPTVEHAFQAAKTDVKEIREQICDADVGEARRIGKSISLDQTDWDNKKYQVMRSLVWQKFFNDSDLANKLVNTGKARLVLNYRDEFWGKGEFGFGFNHMGTILESVRNDLAIVYGGPTEEKTSNGHKMNGKFSTVRDYLELSDESYQEDMVDELEQLYESSLDVQELFSVLVACGTESETGSAMSKIEAFKNAVSAISERLDNDDEDDDNPPHHQYPDDDYDSCHGF